MRKSLLILPLALASSAALAHSGHAGHDSAMLAGLSHPLGGADHLLAMLAVGLWAGQQGGAARWQAPLAFVALLAVGGALGAAGLWLPGVETGIAASVLALGLLVSLSVRMPTVLAMALTAGFAVFHGFAHGVEAPADGSFWLYGAGFAVATAALHAAGFTLNQHLTSTARRVLGAGVAATGGLLLSGML